MSPAAVRRLSRSRRRVCAACRVHAALFQYRGRVRADRDHTLCFRCFRAEVERLRARKLAAPADARVWESPTAVLKSSTSACMAVERNCVVGLAK